MRAWILTLLVLGIVTSAARAESASETRFIASFNASLGRAPSDEERSLWAKVAGESAAFPTDTRNVVRFAFHDLLQREPTPEEVAKASTKLEGGKTSLPRFWSDLANGPEAQFVIQFAAVARYIPSAEVRNYWVTRSGQFAAAQGYVNGNEALANFPVNKDYTPFVDFTYHYLLGRAPSSEETKRDTERLDRTSDARAFWFEVFSGAERQAFVQAHPDRIDLSTVDGK